MGRKLYLILAILVVSASIKGQSVKRQLLSAKAFNFHHSFYVYGYQQVNSNLVFRCFSYSDKLQLSDSASYVLGNHVPSDFLDITADTLHHVINFYFQLADQKNRVTLLRLNDNLKTIANTDNYDANHINSLAAFDVEKYTCQQDIYIIRTAEDSSGKQFYLSKYSVKAMNKPFEYDYQWQFAFERQYIYRASIMYADSNQVMVYAQVFDGPKKGQWVLRINSHTGQLIKGTKLSSKGDTRYFLMSGFIIDKKTKSIDVIGSIYDANMIDLKNKKANFSNQSKGHQLFLVRIDSLGDVSSRIEKAFPLPIQTKTGSILQSFHLKIREFTKQKDGSYDVWADIYEQTQANILAYYSSWHFTIVPNDVDYDIVRSPLSISSKAVPNLISFAKGDTYGKFILNDIGDYDKFKYIKPVNDIVIKTGLDDLNNAFYVLRKTDLLSSRKTIYYIWMGKKGLEYKTIFTSEQGQNMAIFFTGKTSYVSFITNIGNSDFELKINTL
ncbi:MAG: hypothetical protein HY062_00525 [Bacteroidetes bacterium]|nr:hypothetical protein [Bacteroidota bacterium]